MNYGVDLSKLTEEQKGDVSQRLHELQETCLGVEGNLGIVYGDSDTVAVLRREGYDVHACSPMSGVHNG